MKAGSSRKTSPTFLIYKIAIAWPWPASPRTSSRARLIVLDDGFQHRRLARDVDLVLLDALEPFGLGYLFPLRGLLREPIRSLRRGPMWLSCREPDLVTAADRGTAPYERGRNGGRADSAGSKPGTLRSTSLTAMATRHPSTRSRAGQSRLFAGLATRKDFAAPCSPCAAGCSTSVSSPIITPTPRRMLDLWNAGQASWVRISS